MGIVAFLADSSVNSVQARPTALNARMDIERKLVQELIVCRVGLDAKHVQHLHALFARRIIGL